MKKIIIISLLLFIVSNLSCKEQEDNESKPIEVKKNDELKFKVTLNTSTSDDFRLLLNNIKKDNSKINIQVSESLKAGDEDQTIEINIKENYFPQEIIVDLGQKEQKTVDIKDIYIKASNFELNIPKNKINHFFYPNQFISYDSIAKNYNVNTSNKNHLLIFRNRIIDSLWINE